MRRLLIGLLALGSVSAFASEITCGEVSKFTADSEKLEVQITIKKPVKAESIDLANLTGAFIPKGLKKEVISIRLDSLEAYAIHSMAEDGMIKGVQMIFGKAFVCHSSDSLRLGVEQSNESALSDLLKNFKD